MSSASPPSSGEEPLRKHDTKNVVFLVPSWCDICGGILAGSGVQCAGPCKRKCHRGLGKGTENCHADLLQLTCEEGCEHTHGPYAFGDITKQLARDIHSVVKEKVVQEAVQEQDGFGKFQKVRELVDEVRHRWDSGALTRWLVLGQLASVLCMQVGSYVLALALAAPLHESRGWRLAAWQATHSSMSLLFVEALIAAAVKFLAGRMVRYSALVHAFILEIVYIDLAEVNVDLRVAGAALELLAGRVVVASGVIWAAALALWINQLLLV